MFNSKIINNENVLMLKPFCDSFTLDISNDWTESHQV